MHETLAESQPAAGTSAGGRPVPLTALRVGARATVVSVGGARFFRRRLLELGLVPGTNLGLVNAAPLGDPLELDVRGSRLSIRRAQADAILVAPEPKHLPVIP